MTLEQIILYPLRGQRVSYEQLARMARDYATLQNALDGPAKAKRTYAPRKAKTAPQQDRDFAGRPGK
jgi:hypothetical protein